MRDFRRGALELEWNIVHVSCFDVLTDFADILEDSNIAVSVAMG